MTKYPYFGIGGVMFVAGLFLLSISIGTGAYLFSTFLAMGGFALMYVEDKFSGESNDG